MKDKKIIVTGGAGFIGSNLTRKLDSKNNDIVFDNLSTGHLENIKDLTYNNKTEFIKEGFTDFEFLKEAFRDVEAMILVFLHI